MNRYVVDRFENEIVICEDKNGNMIKIDKCLLPTDIKEGSVIDYNNGVYTLNEKAKKEIENRIKDKFDSLKG